MIGVVTIHHGLLYQRYERHEALDLGVLGENWISTAPPRTFKNQHLLDRPPRAIIDLREGRNGPNPSERSFGKLIWVHTNATEESNHSTWEYLARIGYQQPRQEPSKINIC